MPPLHYFLALIRPRTLLLGCAVMLPGNAMAWHSGQFSWLLCLLMLATTLSLQALSNIANDYGDGKRGTDDYRVGPLRMVASGALSLSTVRRMMWGCAALTLLLGTLLLLCAFKTWSELVDFAVLGMLAVLAAVGYTVGRYAYGYYGLGEVAVFVFFGLLAVMGSNYLQTHTLNPALWLLAIGCGVFSAAVLMVNNLRDLDSDRDAGKHTVVVCLGRHRALILYHGLLLFALACYILFALLLRLWGGLLCLLVLPLLLRQRQRLGHAHSAQQIGDELPRIVGINVLVNGLFTLGVVLF